MWKLISQNLYFDLSMTCLILYSQVLPWRIKLHVYVSFKSYVDNIFVIFGGRVFQQTVGIPMGTNCASLLADLFLYFYEAHFIQGLLRKTKRSYPDPLFHVLLYIWCPFKNINNFKFDDFVDRVCATELETKDTTDTARSASYLNLHLEIGSDGR